MGVHGGLGVITQANLTLPKLTRVRTKSIIQELPPEASNSSLFEVIDKLRKAYWKIDAADVNLISTPNKNYIEVVCDESIVNTSFKPSSQSEFFCAIGRL